MRGRIVALALLATPAAAQAPVTVYYMYGQSGANRWNVDDVMRKVLAPPQFLVSANRDPEVLEIAVLGSVTHSKSDKSRGVNFTLGFYRGGEKLGEAAEYCDMDKIAECADQLGADITSASLIRR